MGALSTLAVEVDLTITLETALHIGTGLGLAQVLDDRIVQGPHPQLDHDVNLPYIPGSSLKGRLRAHTRALASDLDWQAERRQTVEGRLFGYPQSPGMLTYMDAYLDLALARVLAADGGALLPFLARSERSFVSLSRQRRVALAGRLFRLELADQDLVFATAIRGVLPAASARADLGLLLAATRVVSHLGGHKARGLGACRFVIERVTLGGETSSWRELVEVSL